LPQIKADAEGASFESQDCVLRFRSADLTESLDAIIDTIYDASDPAIRIGELTSSLSTGAGGAREAGV